MSWNWPKAQFPTDTKRCPDCQSQMIAQYTGEVLLSEPPMRPWQWWCGCGHTEPGGVHREESYEEERMRLWKEAQP